MTKNKAGKHATPPAPTSAFVPQTQVGGAGAPFSSDAGDKPRKGKRKGLKIFGITAGVIVGVLLVVYLIGTVVFMGRFFPHTTIAGIDISLKTPEETHAVLDDTVSDYEFKVMGQGINALLSAKDVGMSLDSEVIATGIMSDMSPWMWPVEVFQEHDETKALVITYGSAGLSGALEPLVAQVNETATQPTDATIAFNQAAGAFEIVPEAYGTALDLEKVVQEVAEGTATLEPKIMLTNEVLVQPAVLKDDERLEVARAEANEMVTADLELMMGGNLVTEVTPALIATWITVSPEVTVTFDDAALAAWLDEVASGCNTVGSERTYTRPDGKQVTVSGGDYGWQIDGEVLRTLVTDSVKAGTVGTVDIPVLQSGNGFSDLGGKDWGARYCDIDLSEQHAYFYDASGALVWESDIITGSPGEHATPTGVYDINWGMESPSKLIGEPKPGETEPEYETVVQYWMPFVGNGIGLHDADWQYNGFGGNLYAQGYGSHGCVNLPPSKAQALYGIIEIGDVVVVHW